MIMGVIFSWFADQNDNHDNVVQDGDASNSKKSSACEINRRHFLCRLFKDDNWPTWKRSVGTIWEDSRSQNKLGWPQSRGRRRGNNHHHHPPYHYFKKCRTHQHCTPLHLHCHIMALINFFQLPKFKLLLGCLNLNFFFQVAQWSDLVVFDFLTGNYDRVSSMQVFTSTSSFSIPSSSFTIVESSPNFF